MAAAGRLERGGDGGVLVARGVGCAGSVGCVLRFPPCLNLEGPECARSIDRLAWGLGPAVRALECVCFKSLLASSRGTTVQDNEGGHYPCKKLGTWASAIKGDRPVTGSS
jgi:hypothetical protein